MRSQPVTKGMFVRPRRRQGDITRAAGPVGLASYGATCERRLFNLWDCLLPPPPPVSIGSTVFMIPVQILGNPLGNPLTADVTFAPALRERGPTS